MTTSGEYDYNPNVATILQIALENVGAVSAYETPRAVLLQGALRDLEVMLKSWQNDGPAWLKQFVYVPLVIGQASYEIGPDSTDAFSDSAESTQFIQRITSITNVVRRNKTSGIEVPLTQLSRSEYTEISDKEATGVPVQVYFDPQRDSGTLYVWPVPTEETEQIKFTCDRIIENAGAIEKTLDIPPDWIEAVAWNLSDRLAPKYGLSRVEREALKEEAAVKYEKALYPQFGKTSTFFQPDR